MTLRRFPPNPGGQTAVMPHSVIPGLVPGAKVSASAAIGPRDKPGDDGVFYVGDDGVGDAGVFRGGDAGVFRAGGAGHHDPRGARNQRTLTRRAALLGLTGLATAGRARLALADTPGEQRFVVVLLRGALDGLAAVVPHGDSGFLALRGRPPEGLLDLGGFYGLHPSLAGLHTLYKDGALLPIHAVAGPYRVRSHFEAQDCLESGSDHRMTSGWLNRVVVAMGGAPRTKALAVGVSVPLLLRGAVTVDNWAPHGMAEPAPDLYAAIAALHRDDTLTGPAIQAGLQERGFSTKALAGQAEDKNRYAFPALARAAGTLLAAPGGPRVAALEIGGWDTHAGQAGRLNAPLKQLDEGLMALKAGLGAAWAQTAVLVMTEFGRTARMNGTGGTDHGTGGVAFVLGGTVAGGRVAGDWPGLSEPRLFENRDLAPTTDLRAVSKGLLAQHLRLSPAALEQIFPDSAKAPGMRGLVRV